MMNTKILGIISIFVMVGGGVSAKEKWSLDSCINYAQEHNINVRSRLLDEAGGNLELTASKNAFLPNVSASVGESFSFGRGLTSQNTYANRNTSTTQWGVSLSVPVFDGLQNARKLKQSKLNLKALLLQTEVARDNVELNLIAQYLQVLFNKELLEISRRQVELSQYELMRQKALAEAGKIAEVDVVQAQSQLASDLLTVADNENNLSLSLVDLAQMMNLRDIDGFDIEPVKDEPLVERPEIIYANAKDNNSSVRQAKASAEAAEAGVEVAQTGYIPRLSLNAGVGSTYYNLSGATNPSFSRQMKDNFNKSVGFSLSIPIFDAFSTRNSVRRAKLQVHTSNLQVEQAETQLFNDIQKAYYAAVGARNKYQTGLQTEESSRIAFETMKEKYEIGRSNPTEFEQARTQYIKAQTLTVQSRLEYILRCRILNFYSRRT